MRKLSDLYKGYMSSSAWAAKRLLVLKRDDCICKSCGKAKATEVHHLSYIHFGDEPLFDLVSVCSKCHRRLTIVLHSRPSIPDIESEIQNFLFPEIQS
jgi:5-methylcytosine-specific restriction endonuclease McrA